MGNHRPRAWVLSLVSIGTLFGCAGGQPGDPAGASTDAPEAAVDRASQSLDTPAVLFPFCPQVPTCGPNACDPECIDSGHYLATTAVVIDEVTHLQWQRATATPRTQADAATYCAGLHLAGRPGWRLPTGPELSGIRYKPGGLFGGHEHYCIPCVDQAAFPATPSAEFWTSRTGTGGLGWYVGFDDGRAHWADSTQAFAFRCVHDP